MLRIKLNKLGELAKKTKQSYENLDSTIKQDCQIKRALQSGEMHNWFVCMNEFHMSSEALGRYYDSKSADKDYWAGLDKHNNLFKEMNTNCRKWAIAFAKNETGKGEKYSKLQLVLFGFDIKEAERLGS